MTGDYSDILASIKIGEIATFKIYNSPYRLKGVALKLYNRNDKTYIKIYSLFLRKEIIYRLTKDMELISLKKKSKNKNIKIYHEEAFYGDDEIKPPNPYKDTLWFLLNLKGLIMRSIRQRR